jgi:transposase-like protein
MEHQGKSFMGCDYNLDEVHLTSNGARHYLWRAVDQDGHVLDILVPRRRNKEAAKKFFRRHCQLNGYIYKKGWSSGVLSSFRG